jgi:O-antigen ligase
VGSSSGSQAAWRAIYKYIQKAKVEYLAYGFMVIPYLAAFVLALLVLPLLTVQYQLASKITPDIRAVIAIVVIASGSILTILFSPRILNETILATAPRQTYGDYADGFAASRWLNLFLVGAGVAELFRGWRILRRNIDMPDPARPILYAMLIFYFGNMAIHLFASEYPDFSFKSLYVPIVLIAIYFQRVENIYSIVQAAKLGILACTLGSLVAMGVAPDFVLHRPESGLIPGVDFRLFGLAPHANALGPAALLGIILEIYWPFQMRWLRWLTLLSTTAVFLLAQSKTVWVASLAVLIVVYVPLSLSKTDDPEMRSDDFNRALRSLLICIAVLISAIAVNWVVDVPEYVSSRIAVATLTGRDLIWDITIKTWLENIFFGYGIGLWDLEFRTRYGMLYVGGAHDQFLQTLGDAGLFGLVFLLAYIGMYFSMAIKCFSASRGVLVSLLGVIVAQFTTETPLSSNGLLSWFMLEQTVFVLLACYYLREEAKRNLAFKARLFPHYQ